MRAGVVELVALEIDLGAFALARLGAKMLGDALGEIERARPPDIMLVQPLQLGVKGGIGLGPRIGLFEVEHQRHQGLGDEAAAENAETAVFVGTVAEGIRRDLVQRAILEGVELLGLLDLCRRR